MAMNLIRLNKNEIASLLGVHVKSIENFYNQKEDPIPFHLDNAVKYYIWSECLDWWVRRHTAKITRFKPEDELQAAKLAGQNLINEEKQLDLEIKKGQLLRVEDVRKVWSDSLVTIKQSLLNVGHIAATDIVDGLKYSQKKAIIDKLLFSNLDKVIEEAKIEKPEPTEDPTNAQ